MNLQDLTYTITSFDSSGNPIVKFGCDGSTQTFPQCPTDTPDNTKAYLDAYVQAYVAGLQLEADQTSTSAVQSLVNQPITPEG